ncbi:TIGR03087 family PEP-CTERM/XrtA system glycosyltransferase [Erythrobacter sp. YT30]|uniref:TIGR03087 family PEP-CTERM/XrtA system glycosyltransferase n=1 Tax=Erythrobacter sp. YT30 TaxID=1735012 RepID=UPI00076CD415|nr:TIGR03087 family PEP-CTERM/XrtA system glycosyltransferase [Erythrobacter sp. YT30]KWV93074.1 glycosyl transferase family 1 [Erythrobacter sp. YT30]
MGDILFLAHRVPFPPNRGDKIRAHHLLKRLAQLGRVHVGCFADSEQDRGAIGELDAVAASHCAVDRKKPLQLAGLEALMTGKPISLTAFHSARLQSWVNHTLRDQPISTVVIFSGQMGQYVPDDFEGRVIVDLCDVDSAKFENYAEAGERVWLNGREGRLLAREEERLAVRADATILISDAEAALFASRLLDAAKTHIQVIGNGIDAAFFDPKKVAPLEELANAPGPHFVFTGQMDYRPNEQAVLWAINNFWPALRASQPDAQLHIVGRNPTPTLMQHARTDGVRIWSEVPDVRPFLAGADCVLAPLLIARGVQNKVLEAMAMEKPVLLSPQAATGIGAVNGENWLVCEPDASAMVALFKEHWADGQKLQKMGKSARAFVMENHDWKAALAPLDDLVAPGGAVRDAA